MMRNLIIGWGCLLLSTSGYAMPAVVDYIIDGDTFAATVQLDDDIDVAVRVRIINIDAPEINGKCDWEIEMAYRAQDKLSEILPSGTVIQLHNIQDDKYLGRIDANVILSDGRDVGRILINEGFARLYDGGKRRGWCN